MSRTTIFAAVRAATTRENLFADPGNVLALDNLLDAFDVPRPETAKDAFTAALDLILHHEGGYVNHPQDPGGRTNLGVTQRTWEGWTGKPATEAEMRGLTRTMVEPLYRKNYWDAVKGDDLPGPLALCLFDMAVNAGPGRAARILQKVLGVPDDGQIGPATIAAVKGWNVRGLVEAYQDARRKFYQSLPTFKTFGRGWLSRVTEVEAKALELVK